MQSGQWVPKGTRLPAGVEPGVVTSLSTDRLGLGRAVVLAPDAVAHSAHLGLETVTRNAGRETGARALSATRSSTEPWSGEAGSCQGQRLGWAGERSGPRGFQTRAEAVPGSLAA